MVIQSSDDITTHQFFDLRLPGLLLIMAVDTVSKRKCSCVAQLAVTPSDLGMVMG
jgi:hypothetical protein